MLVQSSYYSGKNHKESFWFKYDSTTKDVCLVIVLPGKTKDESQTYIEIPISVDSFRTLLEELNLINHVSGHTS